MWMFAIDDVGTDKHPKNLSICDIQTTVFDDYD